MQQIEQTPVEQIESEDGTISVDVEASGVVADGLQDSLHDIADSFDVNGFKCVNCGLAHMHDTMKHRLSDTFGVSETDSAMMDYNPVCHCGLQEAGRHGSEYGIDESSAASRASDAPIPPEASREMNNEYGSL